ncbi:MAG: nuclear transport factor 2 family protein [Hyphomicrobiaceae bacterium]
MSDAEKNTETLKRCYARWHESKGDSVEDWMEILDDQVDFRSLAMGSGSGAEFTSPLSSKTAVKGYFDGLLEQWQMIHYTVDDYVAEGDMVCAIGSTAWTHKGTGKTVDTPKVDVWRFRDGKAVAFFEFYDTAALFAGAS